MKRPLKKAADVHSVSNLKQWPALTAHAGNAPCSHHRPRGIVQAVGDNPGHRGKGEQPADILDQPKTGVLAALHHVLDGDRCRRDAHAAVRQCASKDDRRVLSKLQNPPGYSEHRQGARSRAGGLTLHELAKPEKVGDVNGQVWHGFPSRDEGGPADCRVVSEAQSRCPAFEPGL